VLQSTENISEMQMEENITKILKVVLEGVYFEIISRGETYGMKSRSSCEHWALATLWRK